MNLLVVLLILAAVAAVALAAVYNLLVQKRQMTNNGWADIDVQLKRRYDLIPNLVETVKGYAGHEKQTLEAVIAARNQAVRAEQVGAGQADAAAFADGQTPREFAPARDGGEEEVGLQGDRAGVLSREPRRPVDRQRAGGAQGDGEPLRHVVARVAEIEGAVGAPTSVAVTLPPISARPSEMAP